MRQERDVARAQSPRRPPSLAAVVAGAGIALLSGLGPAGASGSSHKAVCPQTASLALAACREAAQEDRWTTLGACVNRTDPGERNACFAAVASTYVDDLATCDEQRAARLDLCSDLGEGAYDPQLDPADFEADFHHLTHPNPFFPLTPGNQWVYSGGVETNTVELLDQTKSIAGVSCLVARDRVEAGGALIEDTDDWFAQSIAGDVWYCGELARGLESFPGDQPALPELVSIDGSFKAGRDGAQPGVLMESAPEVGDVYRQEFALGEAEDAAEILSTDYSYGDDAELDAFVPAALATLLCHGDCLVTNDFSPLDPGADEHKFYAPGIGLFLEVTPETGEVLRLIGCNFAPLCAALPQP
jgi:hypothetical protein